MRATALTSALVASVLSGVGAQDAAGPFTGALGNATVVTNNPVGVVYTATLPTTEFFNPSDPRGNIKGVVSATANPDGVGVTFTVDFSNLPTSGGDFLYHLHAAPVPSDGNCTGTLAHLDPFLRPEKPACDRSLPKTCQVGDLSGKHGQITSDPFHATYNELYASTAEGLGSFFGNRSLTVHFANATRITCANFTVSNVGGGGNGGGAGNSTPPNPTGSNPPPPQPSLGAAAQTLVPTFSLLAAIAAAVMI